MSDPGRARHEWPRARSPGSLTPWLPVSGASRQIVSSSSSPCAPPAEHVVAPRPCATHSGAVGRAADHVWGQIRITCVTIAVARRMPPAITPSSLERCSAPCKALRFAPTPPAAGPSGLDGACAPLRREHLRDGRLRDGARIVLQEALTRTDRGGMVGVSHQCHRHALRAPSRTRSPLQAGALRARPTAFPSHRGHVGPRRATRRADPATPQDVSKRWPADCKTAAAPTSNRDATLQANFVGTGINT